MKQNVNINLIIIIVFCIVFSGCSNHIYNSIVKKCNKIEIYIISSDSEHKITEQDKKSILEKIGILKELSLNIDPSYSKVINIELKQLYKDIKEKEINNKSIYEKLLELETEINNKP